VAIGVFDGVHRGHQQLISRAVELAAQRDVAAVVLTFDPHPLEVIRPGSHPAVLTTTGRKAELVAQLGADALCVLPFTTELALLSPAEFVREILVQRLHAAAVVVGANFTFGHKAAGSVASLAELGEYYGFTVEAEGLVTADSPGAEPVTFSSTYVRSRVAAGDVAAAGAALGRPHRVEGVVVRGDGRGSELGYPTANVSGSPFAAIPADGVYACWFQRGRRTPARAAVSVGTNPTFAGQERRVEAYLLDESPDLYGERVGVDFVTRIRGMVCFDSAAELVARMDTDVAETRSLLA
jgi:riboflavin kinase/FMN adenylyltransferase